MADKAHQDDLYAAPDLGLKTGEVLSGRYVLGTLAGRGGMGAVYRATDLSTNAAVAIKVATSERQGNASRFAQEVAVLSRLSHPAIVRYLGAGIAPAGHTYLVMEWLEGETLAARLLRERLDTAQALSVMRQSCEALAVAHAADIVHRDLKPGNVFLVDHAIDRVKLLDFGIARQHDSERTITQSGTVLGTFGYMAPEQALGSREVDARADVFALGCMFFECLVGRAAFTGAHAVAVMAKVLHETPPSLRQLRPELSEALEALLTRMLNKEPAQRPADAAAVLQELDALELQQPQSPAPRSAEGLTRAEHQVVSVVFARPRVSAESEPSLTYQTAAESSDPEEIEAITRRFGCEPVFLRAGALMVVMSEHAAVTDLTVQAARCALRLQQARPELQLSVATGRAITAGQQPVGHAIDRAADLLASTDSFDGIAVDEVTAALLEQSFVLQREAAPIRVLQERSEQQASRLVLGRPTPFVGRDKELSLLERTLNECVEDSVARVALVVGAPGQGKSRLRHELVTRVHQDDSARVLMARADPVGAGSALLLIRQLVRGAVGLHGGDPATHQYRRLRDYVQALFAGDVDAARWAEFLGELIGAPSADKPSPELRAARNDPQIMSVWLRRSFVQWLAAENADRPLLLVLEDLHWGDAASVMYLGEALRTLSEAPLMLLALARPELTETFPKLWAFAEPQLVQLSRLTSRAAQRLVRAVLGRELPDADIGSLVERADGNPFHLEELMRRVVEAGDADGLPESVVALVQTRLQRLDPVARRSARAASVFGETFWAGGVAKVLGADTPPQDITYALAKLQEEELIHASDDSRFSDEREYTFRHGLLREAAYSMLTDLDRQSGHALAGAWLRETGEKDALTLAQHFELGALPNQAVPWYLAAAQSAADGGNVDDAIALARRGLDCGAQGVERGRLHLVHVEAAIMRAQWREAVTASQAAAANLPPGSALWFKAAAGPLLAGTFLGDLALTQDAIRTVLSVPLDGEATGPYGLALFWACQALLNVSQVQVAEAIMQRAQALADAAPDADPVFRVWLGVAQGFAQLLRGDLGAIESLASTREQAERAGAVFGRALAAMYEVAAYAQTGDASGTSLAAERARAASEPTGLHVANDWATYFHALVYTRERAPKAELLTRVIEPLRGLTERGDHRLAITAQNLLSLACLHVGDTQEAERLTQIATAGAHFPQELATTLAVRAHIELQQGRIEPALELAERGLAASTNAIFPWTGTLLLVARARALHGLGRTQQAHEAITLAKDTVLRIASTIAKPELRESYLNNIDANVLALELSRAWLASES